MKLVDKIKISRLLSYLLRHNPLEIDLKMTPDGWVNSSDLIERLRVRKGITITFPDLQELVENDPKKRYTLRDDGCIRANQGHTIEDVSAISPTPLMPPEILYHGTTEQRWEKIQESDGLSKMKRHHVHLSVDYETALEVAKRHKKETPTVLKIDAFTMFLDHFNFYQADNGVWVVDRVPLDYLKVSKKPNITSQESRNGISPRSLSG
jgi:putative RNA 2'-phosphotransferase